MKEHFEFFAYNSPTDGKFYINDVEYTHGEDYRSVKRYKEYANVGFTMLMLQQCNTYYGEYWETSACKKCLDTAKAAGIKRVIVDDKRLRDIIKFRGGIIGEDKQFKSEQQLDAYVAMCVEKYSNHESFYGILLNDEPMHYFLESYGQVVKSLKRVLPGVYLHCNLLPYSNMDWLADNEINTRDSFYSYLNKFIDQTGHDSICVDEYAFRSGYVIGPYSILTFQTMANVARDRGVSTKAVLQAFVHYNGQRLIHRHMTESDMYWQTNLVMGLGFKEFAFFTYMTKPRLQIAGYLMSDGIDGGALVNHDGTRTRLYSITKKIIAEMKDFESVMLKYSYLDNYVICEDGKTYDDFPHIKEIEHNEKIAPIKVVPSGGVVFETELESKQANSKMFMIENISNVKEEMETGEIMTAKIDLTSVLNGAKDYKLYFRGKQLNIKDNNGIINRKLRCGDAIFIEVFY